ncbi:MAG: TIGR00159 family protein [Candidatus Melainabacteria bacterium]|jgi:diadenylate cyclase|nr:MAG: TIGR00159 family protein [Candidatus Melainabacteria bacterium]
MIEDLLMLFQNFIGSWHIYIKDTFGWKNIFEIFIIAAILIVFYQKFIKNTNSEKFVKGAVALVFLWILSEILVALDLTILGVFIRSIVTLVALSLIVIFQPELRRFLGYLGQIDFFKRLFESDKNDESNKSIDVIKEIIEAVKYLSKSHTGALIVFQNDLSNTYHDVGTRLNADVSTELLLTIFHVNTPLHDGAVVISGSKIISAGVLLPLTDDPKLSWKYGTRHRAAIGMTETSNAACLVVSEETGDVSVTLDGTLKKYDDIPTLKADLENILGYKKPEQQEKKSIFNLENLVTLKKDRK